MENKIKDAFDKILKSKNKKNLMIIICILGVMLILLSEFIPSIKTECSKNERNYTQYILDLEKKTSDIVSSIDGVGKCRIMITLDETDESFYAKNTDEKSESGSISQKNEYVMYEDNNNDTPILLKQSFPKVKGIAIVCQGGDNVYVKEQITSAVSSLFGISSNSISISKMNG